MRVEDAPPQPIVEGEEVAEVAEVVGWEEAVVVHLDSSDCDLCFGKDELIHNFDCEFIVSL